MDSLCFLLSKVHSNSSKHAYPLPIFKSTYFHPDNRDQITPLVLPKKERAPESDYKRNRGTSVEVEGEELFEHYTLTATPGQKALRVDKFLTNLLPNVSRSRIQSASRNGCIHVNDQEVKASYKVRPGDVVRMLLPYPPPPELEPEEMPLDIRYEDPDLMVLYKPANMVVHPGVGNHRGTLVNGLLWYLQHKQELPTGTNEEYRAGLVHRLDKNTTGTMVVAKTELALGHLSQQFYDRTTDRLYHALVWGDVKEEKGTIEAHLGRDLKNRKVFRVFPKGDHGKHAITHYQVLERFGIATLVQLKLETGRTHQIRVHMKYLGHPLFGDYDYGGDKIQAGLKTKKFQQFIRNCLELMPGQALHAKTLGFDHPRTGERLFFDSELPDNFVQVLEKFRTWAEAYG
jgi:23S rRNA pseudouridine1911/1915/1917 synthase